MWPTLLIVIVFCYFLSWILFYFLQHFAFFRPEILPSNFSYDYTFPFEELHFDMEDGGSINGIYFKVPNSLGVIYYLKGNSRSIKGWGKFAKDFVGKGYDFFLIDYRGFGKSKGRRTEQKLYSDSQYIYKWLTERYDEEKIVVFGRSFGSGIAARIASWNNPRMLILDSPYYSFAYRIKSYIGAFMPLRWLLRYKIPTNLFLKKVNCPIHIIHGTKDRLIPFVDGKKLFDENPEKVNFYPIKGGRHNNLPEFSEFHNLLYDILTGEN
jgi:pimeloyl-ACP methyl ester carboxylesterase